MLEYPTLPRLAVAQRLDAELRARNCGFCMWQ
jgi:hypothetical protein